MSTLGLGVGLWLAYVGVKAFLFLFFDSNDDYSSRRRSISTTVLTNWAILM